MYVYKHLRRQLKLINTIEDNRKFERYIQQVVDILPEGLGFILTAFLRFKRCILYCSMNSIMGKILSFFLRARGRSHFKYCVINLLASFTSQPLTCASIHAHLTLTTVCGKMPGFMVNP